jgi:16S rRNA (cytosine1402-N4)-methyltransferase
MEIIHKSVLLKEVVEYLDPKPGENFIDCTFGGGGHGVEILRRVGSGGRVLGIDADKCTVDNFQFPISNFQNKEGLILVNDNFVNLKSIYEHNFCYQVSGILFDLGLSSMELADEGRGFSFLKNSALDMRFDINQELTAAEIVNNYKEQELFRVFRELGEVDFGKAKKISRVIVELRRKKRIETTFDLVALILETFYPKAWQDGKITVETKEFYQNHRRINHPATKFFQALRIETNKELENLEKVLPEALDILRIGGRLVVISFHSLEDRIVKNCFREWGREGKVKILTKKPIVPSEEETRENPRARSAKMRAVVKA